MEIYACEEKFLTEYLNRESNLSSKELEAIALFVMPEQDDFPRILSINGEIATIEIKGILSKKGPSRFGLMYGYGGTGYGEINTAIDYIENNESIKTVKFIIDTPGGIVSGVDETHQRMKALSKKKTTYAVNVGMIASAGYWLAVAVENIYSTSPANITGSIGVCICGIDWSKYDSKVGIKEIAVLSKNAPDKMPGFDKEGIKVLQSEVDALERVFYQRISQGRNTDFEYIANNYGKGSVLVSQDIGDNHDAIKAGMIDGLVKPEYLSLDEPIENFLYKTEHIETIDKNIKNGNNVEKQIKVSDSTKQTASADNKKQESSSMNLKDFRAQEPAEAALIDKMIADAKTDGFAQGKASMEALIKKTSIAFDPEKSYPAAIQSLAKKVLDGKEEPAALTGAITVFDAQAEQRKSDNAKIESDALKDTHQKLEDGKTDGLAKTPEDIAALSKKDRGLA